MKLALPLTVSALAIALTSCGPVEDRTLTEAMSACARTEVQDVVGKEVRKMLLEAAKDRVVTAAFFGIDLTSSIENARVSFHDVGTFKTSPPPSPPYKQILCGGTMQIDGSSARAGQDIVTLPRLRWSINFVQPTNDPATAGFSIAVDPANVWQDMLVNGKPVENGEANPAKPEPAPVAPQPQAEGAAAETQDVAAEAAAADAAAAEAERAAADHQPSDEDLYAPHPN